MSQSIRSLCVISFYQTGWDISPAASQHGWTGFSFFPELCELKEPPETVQVRTGRGSPISSQWPTKDPAGRLHNAASRLCAEQCWACSKTLSGNRMYVPRCFRAARADLESDAKHIPNSDARGALRLTSTAECHLFGRHHVLLEQETRTPTQQSPDALWACFFFSDGLDTPLCGQQCALHRKWNSTLMSAPSLPHCLGRAVLYQQHRGSVRSGCEVEVLRGLLWLTSAVVLSCGLATQRHSVDC